MERSVHRSNDYRPLELDETLIVYIMHRLNKFVINISSWLHVSWVEDTAIEDSEASK